MAVRLVLIPLLILLGLPAIAQLAPPNESDSVRVNVTVNPDGTRTSYQFDQAHRQATATTTTPDGKVTGKIKYDIDDAGRFGSGLVYGPNDKFMFKAVYKYTAEGRLDQEIRYTKDNAMINRLVYSYDSNGRQTGYVVMDASGNVIGRTSPVKATPAATAKPHRGR